MASKPSGYEVSRTGSPKSSVRSRHSAVGILGLWWKCACGLLMVFVIYGAFFIAKGAVNFARDGDGARIVFFHVPVAIQCQLWFVIAAVYSVRVLLAQPVDPAALVTDAKAATAMELGFVASMLATITGSVFANVEWGSYWNGDPRETSIVGLLLIYGSYLVLRGAIRSNPQRRARLGAVYATVTVVPATFLILVLPKIPAVGSVHPTNVVLDASATSPNYKLVLYVSFAAFTMLFVWLFQLRLRALAVASHRQTGRVQ